MDHEAGTIVWPNGADVDPDTLYEEAHRSPRLSPGQYIVHAEELWLASPHRLSFDSRYFGAVPRTPS